MLQVLSTLLSLASLCTAWSINGHLYGKSRLSDKIKEFTLNQISLIFLVANIAQNLLEENAPDSLLAANELFHYLCDYDADYCTHEDQHAFVESATFADDFKYHGEGWQSDFHFIDLPNIEEGSASDYELDESPRNLTTGVSDIVAWLSGKEGDDYQSSYMYTYLMDKFGDENVAKSFAIRLLIHYIGDLVQPLHCETRYDEEFPAGDKGGNDFPLKYHYDVDELHALWDKIMYDGYHNIARPFTEDTWADFQPQVSYALDNYPPSSTEDWQSTDYDYFAQLSYNIAIQVYDGL